MDIDFGESGFSINNHIASIAHMCIAAAADKSRSTLGIKALVHYALMLVSRSNSVKYLYDSYQKLYFVAGIAFCSREFARAGTQGDQGDNGKGSRGQ